jgi:anti-sigma factor RsiW
MSTSDKRSAACEDYELLISKACDGECSPDEMTALGEHLKVCGSCREMMGEYREIKVRVASYVVSMSCPPPPLVTPKWRKIASRLSGRLGIRRFVPAMAGLSVCVLFFLLGHFSGSYQTQARLVRNLSPVVVATPSLWMADRAPGSPNMTSVDSEQPFTDGISRYRAAIADELRKDSVDWLRVRELVESMGELRTNLELLTIHMAYIDIRTGSLPSAVASHWESLGSKNERTVVKR